MRRLILATLYPFLIFAATKYAGEFEELGVSARVWGLGGAAVAAAFDPSTIYYNPAGSVYLSRSAFLMHQENYNGMVKNDFLGFVFPARPSSFGLGVYHTGVPNIILTGLPNDTLPPSETNQPESTGVTGAADWIVYLNYARLLNQNLSFGGNAKVIYRTLGSGSAFGMGIDLGLLYQSFVDAGLRIRNLSTSPLFWSTKTRESIMPRIALGLSKNFRWDVNRIRLSLEQELQMEGLAKTALHHIGNLSLEENFGFEYSYKDKIMARLGFYKHRLCYGLGGRYRNFFLDYAYESFDLGANHRVSGGITF
jgi:hypothetical protein